MHRLTSIVLGTALIVGFFAGSVFAWCWATDNCPAIMTGCTLDLPGGCWQSRAHRCDGEGCGLYDPDARDCQYRYTWDTYRCVDVYPTIEYYCETNVEYFEFCLAVL